MIDDTNTTPVPDATDPVRSAAPSGVGADRLPRDLCLSVFDRWRCGLAHGHGGHHESLDGGSAARWSDGATGRRLKDL
ncbi:hypothetical protein ACQXVK_07290 [Curtobacterium sp. AB451]|uniref:hypothetical protein n=1 Tax=unclassified Curtobacterium TaxID=257496 RepID=UPI00034C550F|nr:hypothetical protein [Curtobacterium sp. B18]